MLAERSAKEAQKNRGQLGHNFETKEAYEIGSEDVGERPSNGQQFIRLNTLVHSLIQQLDSWQRKRQRAQER